MKKLLAVVMLLVFALGAEAGVLRFGYRSGKKAAHVAGKTAGAAGKAAKRVLY